MNFENKRLILVSNAEPYVHRREESDIVCEKQAGGLTSAMDPLLQTVDGLWIAWGRGGEADFDILDRENKVKVPNNEGYTLKRLELSEEEVDGFYLGFSNRVLWPICHSMHEKSILKDYSSSKKYWDLYYKVNQKYAEAVLEEIERDDLIWIHDYHLTLVPQMIREKQPEANIAFFWHIPWPPWEMFGIIPWEEEIMDGILASDYIGFHTSRFRDNFLSCADFLGRDVDEERSQVIKSENNAKISAVPLGIDYNRYSSMAKKEKVKKKTKYLKDEINAEKIIVSVDRLDYTKGIPERIKAFELFLEENPEFQRKITLVQRIPPSRRSVSEYQSILNKIHRMVGEINGNLGRANWTPIKSFHRFLPDLEELIPYYMVADVALVTPLIDGMNLVCKEYIASVDDGVLILSNFAGSSVELKEAIQVNPYDAGEVAQGIKKALTMTKRERKERLEILKDKVKRRDLTWWRDKFLSEWLEVSK
ncbi:alpha,alpha-trehalose-phosphate synthase [candidate division MSBL1 archaeon SCGC-AAA259I14]|uniref:Alpha,alpha-trehalose-phosphate synthase n=1 Tax=candidate division MSBL1 archaeon SCGC-AAA259I14 TaxID=1698268 RepID=A0A133UT96_9EURY|nr:alpha,alpha-trehalose-phosphate synthase [candidate division MSBL1 archaeon SCGC-AAA259I14]